MDSFDTIALPATDLPRHLSVAIKAVGGHRWRVTRHDGGVLGYVEHSPDGPGHPFHATRLIPRQSVFVSVGEFWSLADAVTALA
jgi:hypothetical protein